MQTESTSTSAGEQERPGLRLLALSGLLLAGFAVQWSALHAPFVFDDLRSILENPNVRQLWPLSQAMGAVEGSGSSGRPLVALSLAINYAVGGFEVLGYHLFNIAVHLAATLALFGLVRRSVLLKSHPGHATHLAFACSLLWCLHPLHTDALNHIVYRNETMMACFYLVALYAALRSFESARGRGWICVAASASAGAMASKEVAVSLPIVALLMDRALVSGSLRESWRKHRALYLALASTWLVLAACLWWGDRGGSVGRGGVERFDYVRAQVFASWRYLELAFWPQRLTFDYGAVPMTITWSELWPSIVAHVFLISISVYACAHNRIAGWLGVSYFCILAPTTSFIPLGGELVGEHRMVLPLACLITLVVLALDRVRAHLPHRFGTHVVTIALALVATALGWRTHERNLVYGSAMSLWSDTIIKVPENSRAHQHLSNAYRDAGMRKRAADSAREAARLSPKDTGIRDTLAAALFEVGASDEAEQVLRESLLLEPNRGRTHANLANLLASKGRFEAALEHFERATERLPRETALRFQYAQACQASGRKKRARVQLELLLEQQPGHVGALRTLKRLGN